MLLINKVICIFLEYLEFILYGLIQGLTEFIPVSSTAHLKVISFLLGVDDPGSSLSAIIQLGSVFALVFYFKNDIFNKNNNTSKRLLSYFLQKKLVKSILIGTIPIVLLGGFIKLFIPNFFDNILRSNLSIALVSFLMAFLMYMADSSKKGSINLYNYSYKNGFLIGFFQAFAIIPGVSRSGVTISTALISGWERSDAAKFSFLLGIPAISIAAIAELVFSFKKFNLVGFLPLVVGLITTFFSSLLAISFLIKYFSKNGLKLFIIYRVLFGIVILFNL